MKSSTDATYSLAGQTSPSTLTFTKSDITEGQRGTSFDFVVKATTAADTSDQSDALSVKAVDPPSAPAQPVLLSQDRTVIQLGWQSPDSDGYSSLEGYRLYWNGGSG